MGARWFYKNPYINNSFCLKRFCIKIFFNKKFNEILVLGLRLLPLHPHDGCKLIRCRGETFEILDFNEEPSSHSNGFYILGISFSFTLTFSLLSIRLYSFEHAMTIVGYLCLLFEVILCLMLIFFLHPCFLLFTI